MRAQTFDDDADRPLPSKKDLPQTTYPRIRSGSGTTTTSESADEVVSHVGPTSLSSSSSIDSSQTSGGSLNRRTPPPSSGFMANNILNSSKHNPRNTLSAKGSHTHSILSPVVNRVLANDAGAMAEYMKRNRSGSQGEPSQHVIVEPSSSHVTRTGGFRGSVDDPTTQKYAFRRLRPSISAAALNQSSPTSIVPRFRAGTNPSNSRPPLPFTMQPSVEAEDAHDRIAPKRGGKLSSLQEPDEPPGSIPPVPPPKDTSSFHQQNSSLS